MAGAGTIESQDKTVDSRFQFMKPQDCASENEFAGNWYEAVPPLWGCSGGIGPSDYFGRTLTENAPENVKIGVVVVGVPGCKIELFGKTGYEGLDTYNNVPSQYNGSAYAWLLDLAKKAQKDGVIKGFILHQGESNTGDQQWPTKVKGVYDNLIADLGLDASKTPLLAGELLYQNQGGVCWGHNSIIATLPNVIPNSYVISAEGLPGKDDYHFNSEGNRTFGVRYAQQMLALQPNGPSVVFTEPLSEAFSAVATIPIDVDVSASTSTITHVDFYLNDESTPFHEEWVAPYGFDWEDVEAGDYTIKAIAYDEAGNSAEDIVAIKVNVAQAPFSGTPTLIPGTIQFENFDIGGNGFAYLDNAEGNTGGADYRMDESVDIEDCSDVGGGYNIGFATAGEWLEYTVDVETAGLYDLTIRAACNGDGHTVSLSANDKVVAKDIEMPNTTDWQVWTDVVVNDVELEAGTQVLRLTIGEVDYVNLNSMTFNSVSFAITIPLKTGWNFIGYPYAASQDIEAALSSVWEYTETVKNMDTFYDRALSPALNSLTELDFANGYLIKVNSDCQLIWNK